MIFIWKLDIYMEIKFIFESVLNEMYLYVMENMNQKLLRLTFYLSPNDRFLNERI